jgi:hypothetical protein
LILEIDGEIAGVKNLQTWSGANRARENSADVRIEKQVPRCVQRDQKT